MPITGTGVHHLHCLRHFITRYPVILTLNLSGTQRGAHPHEILAEDSGDPAQNVDFFALHPSQMYLEKQRQRSGHNSM